MKMRFGLYVVRLNARQLDSLIKLFSPIGTIALKGTFLGYLEHFDPKFEHIASEFGDNLVKKMAHVYSTEMKAKGVELDSRIGFTGGATRENAKRRRT